MDELCIALVGDYDPDVIAHQAIPRALDLAARELGVDVRPRWVPTDTIGADVSAALGDAAGVWCVPASPYRSMEGALAAIRFARETGLPFLGTCGGFQYALLEYARNVLGMKDADHGESNPGAAVPLITPLACALVEATGGITLVPGSRAAALYGATDIIEQYRCSYGLNPRFRDRLEQGALHVTGTDAAGDVRVVELDGHPFFLATLFQPERSALRGATHPVIRELVRVATIRRASPSNSLRDVAAPRIVKRMS